MRVLLACTVVAAALAFSTVSRQVEARTTCVDSPQGRLCSAAVDFQQFYQRAYQTQQQSQWCWAASISMLFAYNGYQVSQERIVTEVYGDDVNMPAMAGIVMAEQVNRDWTDDLGERFRSRVTGVYDYTAGVSNLTNEEIISNLDRDKPLIIGAGTHAMVLTRVDYIDTVVGPNVVGGGVFDPWPTKGARDLEWWEVVPAHLGGGLIFLTSVDVQPLSDTTTEDSGEGRISVQLLLLLLLFGLTSRRRIALLTQTRPRA